MKGAGAIAAIGLSFALVSAALCAQSKDLSVKDPRMAVRIGVARFKETDLNANQATEADTIPMRIQDYLSAIMEHSISAEETEAYRAASLTAKITEVGTKLDENLRGYDLKILTEKSVREAQSARRKLDAGLTASKADYSAYSSLDPGVVKVLDRKPIEWVKPSAAQKIFAYPDSGPRVLCVAQDLDILISGSIKGSNGYAFLEVYAYHRYMDKRIFEWKTAFAEDDSQAAIAEFSSALAKSILGRETTSLSVVAEPADAEIRVDGDFVGNGAYLSPYEKPGKHEVAVSCPGYAARAFTVVLEEGKETVKSVALESLDLGELGFASVPEGASVYIGATRVGASPMDLPVLDEPRSGRVKAEGYQDETFVIPGDSSASLSVKLETKEEAEKNSFDKQRDRFYLSAGAFMVSLPVSVVCVGMFNQYYQNLTAIGQGSYTDDQKIAAGELMDKPFYGWQVATYASCGLSSALLGFCVYRFVLYLKASR